MMAPSNPTPLVIFALIAMLICGMLGIMLGQDPFGPGQEVRAEQARTQLAVEVRGTSIAMGALETPTALSVQQTVQAAQWADMPAQQAATQTAGILAVEVAGYQSTQTAIAGELWNRQLALQSTQTAMARSEQMAAIAAGSTSTAMAQEQARERMNSRFGSAAIVLLLLAVCVWILARTVTQILHARAQEKLAQARFLAEQRRMASVRASLQKANGSKPRVQVPNSLMKKTGDINKLPKAE
jgi:hypothetical protein